MKAETTKNLMMNAEIADRPKMETSTGKKRGPKKKDPKLADFPGLINVGSLNLLAKEVRCFSTKDNLLQAEPISIKPLTYGEVFALLAHRNDEAAILAYEKIKRRGQYYHDFDKDLAKTFFLENPKVWTECVYQITGNHINTPVVLTGTVSLTRKQLKYKHIFESLRVEDLVRINRIEISDVEVPIYKTVRVDEQASWFLELKEKFDGMK